MDELLDPEWQDWYSLTPLERMDHAAQRLKEYIAEGGSLDPEYDPQSPFNFLYYPDGLPLAESGTVK